MSSEEFTKYFDVRTMLNKIPVAFKSLHETFDQLILQFEKVKAEFSLKHKVNEYTDFTMYELDIPGYKPSEISVKIHSPTEYGFYTLEVIAMNERNGKSGFATYIDGNIDLKTIETLVEHGVLYINVPRAKYEKKITEIPVH